MSLLFSIKKSARLPSVEMTLSSSAIFDLAQSTLNNFVYRKRPQSDGESYGARTVVSLVVVDAPTKKVRLDIPADLSDELGAYECHVELTIGGLIMVIPAIYFDEFRVTETI